MRMWTIIPTRFSISSLYSSSSTSLTNLQSRLKCLKKVSSFSLFLPHSLLIDSLLHFRSHLQFQGQFKENPVAISQFFQRKSSELANDGFRTDIYNLRLHLQLNSNSLKISYVLYVFARGGDKVLEKGPTIKQGKTVIKLPRSRRNLVSIAAEIKQENN